MCNPLKSQLKMGGFFQPLPPTLEACTVLFKGEMLMKCDGEFRFRINKPKVIHEDFGGEVVIIHFDTGRYYTLNKTASFMWQLIDGGAAGREIVVALTRNWACDSVDIPAVAEAFLTELLEEDLIVTEQSADGARFEPQDNGDNPADPSEKPAFVEPTISGFNDMQELLLLDPIHDVDETGWPSAQKE